MECMFTENDDGTVTVHVTRDLKTSDSNDFEITPDEEFDLAWSINTRTSSTSSYHDKRGSVKAVFESANSDHGDDHDTHYDDDGMSTALVDDILSFLLEDSAAATSASAAILATATLAINI